MNHNRERLTFLHTAATVVVAIVLGIAALRFSAPFTAPVGLAALAAIILTPAASAIERRGAPAEISSAIVVLGAAIAVALTIYALFPAGVEVRDRLPDIARELEEHLRNIQRDVETSSGASPVPEPEQVAESGQKLVTDIVLRAPAVFGGFLFATFLTYFLIAERRLVRRKCLECVQDFRARLALARAFRQLQADVGRYLLTILLINIVLGACVALLFYILEFGNPLIWGAIMALLNFMPYIGPLIFYLLILVAGLLDHASFEKLLLPILIVALLNLIEGNLITPRLIGRQNRISPLMVFISVATGAWLWGAAGAIIAAPALILARALGRGRRPMTQPRGGRRHRQAESCRTAADRI